MEFSQKIWEDIAEGKYDPKYIGIVTDEFGEKTIGYLPSKELEEMKKWRDEMNGCVNVKYCKVYKIIEVVD
jgi:hypothetical protein